MFVLPQGDGCSSILLCKRINAKAACQGSATGLLLFLQSLQYRLWMEP
jgi:hypothetical protein